MKKKVTIEQVQRDVLLKALPHVPFDGWTKGVLDRGVQEADCSDDLAKSVFPNGVRDLVIAFAHYIDEKVSDILYKTDATDMRVRDKIAFGVQTRLGILEEYREVERLAVAFWSHPRHSRRGLKNLWHTADIIWDFAGDTATDYNRYTKRILLSGVLAKTILYWLQDESEEYAETYAFVGRQIEGIVSRGKMLGRFKVPLETVWSYRPFRSV